MTDSPSPIRREPLRELEFGTPGPSRLVRHPLYVGWFFAFWMMPTMTYAHLLFAIATTAYILLAIQFEERDLVHEHGNACEEYRRSVPMLVPFIRSGSPARRRMEKAGAAAFIFFLIKGVLWLALAAVALWR